MNTCSPLVSLAVIAFAGTFVRADAVVEGRVALPKATTVAVVNKRYQVATKGGEVTINPPQAVVFLEGNFSKSAVQPVAQMSQKNLAFVTPLLPVRVGTKVEFPNLDDGFHSIFSYSPAKRFDLGRYRPEERPIPSQVFDTPGLVTLRCDIHEHMRGLVMVLETPHFTVTKTDGTFRLTGLPTGQYKLKVWLSSTKTLEREVDLKGAAPLHVDFQ